jgi:hypothetical protein
VIPSPSSSLITAFNNRLSVYRLVPSLKPVRNFKWDVRFRLSQWEKTLLTRWSVIACPFWRACYCTSIIARQSVRSLPDRFWINHWSCWIYVWCKSHTIAIWVLLFCGEIIRPAFSPSDKLCQHWKEGLRLPPGKKPWFVANIRIRWIILSSLLTSITGVVSKLRIFVNWNIVILEAPVLIFKTSGLLTKFSVMVQTGFSSFALINMR